jgi:Protein of unknown function (DUF2997)
MAEESIELIISKDGTVTAEGLGFSGPVCDTVMRRIAEALGEVEDVQRKPEFTKAAAIQHRERA